MTDNKRSNNKRNSSKYRYDYSLDVLTDGSEMTEPTLFLSVSRRSVVTAADSIQTENDSKNNNNDNMNDKNSTLLARYALMGVGEMTGRLAADQKISLGSTKAVFCHNNHYCNESKNGINGGGIWGILGLLFALKEIGAAELTIVVGNEADASMIDDTIQELVRATNPRIRIAAVPRDNDKYLSPKIVWWKMYQDEYVVVHSNCVGNACNLIYLVTCRQHDDIPNHTIVLLPGLESRQQFLDTWKEPQNRIVLEAETQLSIRIVLTIGVDKNEQRHARFRAQVQDLFPGIHIFACDPKIRDTGILIRGRAMSKLWNEAFPSNILCHLPCTSKLVEEQSLLKNSDITYMSSCSSYQLTREIIFVDRARSIRERIHLADRLSEDVTSMQAFFHALESRSDSQSTVPSSPPWDGNEIDIDDDDSDSDKSQSKPEIAVAVSGHALDATPQGDTLIDTLRSDAPHLLVLGTGCAAPSAYRGSSAYGLLFPQRIKQCTTIVAEQKEALLLTAIIECGEGTLSMLQRFLPMVASIDNESSNLEIHLLHVKFIWISHAHLDHYGGLPSVVEAIYRRRQTFNDKSRAGIPSNQNKRQRWDEPELIPPLVVIAPEVVLKYLNAALRCRNGFRECTSGAAPEFLFRSFHHGQPKAYWPLISSFQLVRDRLADSKLWSDSATRSNGTDGVFCYRPFAFWSNVRVEHCANAFGFVTGVRVPESNFTGDYCMSSFLPKQQGESIVTFAYSGDTRPCHRLVQQCLLDCAAFGKSQLDFLLHEATFDDDEGIMSNKKRHSTKTEALKVAVDAKAANVILTHFSQRYQNYPPMALLPALRKAPIIFAHDGMLIPMKSRSRQVATCGPEGQWWEQLLELKDSTIASSGTRHHISSS